ncbi:MAG: hypothetical protein AAFV98_24690 [Chloroflexota bacterium]
MGIRFSLHLYFPVSRLECVLNEIIKLTEPPSEGRMSIWLPNGKKVVVPHTMKLVPDKSRRRITIGSNLLSFDTVLLLSLDSVIEEYLRRIHLQPLDRTKKYGVGLLAVSIQTGENYAEVSISAVSSSQNEIMLKSPVMHGTMSSLIKDCDGVFALIDTETGNGFYERLLLADTSKVLSIDVVESNYGEDIDYIVTTAQKQLAI